MTVIMEVFWHGSGEVKMGRKNQSGRSAALSGFFHEQTAKVAMFAGCRTHTQLKQGVKLRISTSSFFSLLNAGET
jgi:hypothetical protein